MKVTIVGGGAAGLSTAIVIRGMADVEVTILERAGADEAPGLGIALLPFSLEMIKMKGFAAYADRFVPVDRKQEVFVGQFGKGDVLRKMRMQDVQYFGVKRASLIAFLKEAAVRAGAKIHYNADVSEDAVRKAKDSCDLLIGADGAGSAVRGAFAKEFNARAADAKSRYAWLELEGDIGHFVFGYMYVAGRGLVRITAYPHSRDGSSAILTHSMGMTKFFDEPHMLDADGEMSGKAINELNTIFAVGLHGRKLVGRSRWRRFHATQCQHAVFENVALTGDASATLFYETGWGTSTAIQTSSILGHSLALGKPLAGGLEVYDRKCAELLRGAITATVKTMRDVDGQATRFFQAGPAKFLAMGNA